MPVRTGRWLKGYRLIIGRSQVRVLSGLTRTRKCGCGKGAAFRLPAGSKQLRRIWAFAVRRPEIVVQSEYATAVGFLCLTRADERGGPGARCRWDSCRSPVVLFFSHRCRVSERVAATRLSINSMSFDKLSNLGARGAHFIRSSRQFSLSRPQFRSGGIITRIR